MYVTEAYFPIPPDVEKTSEGAMFYFPYTLVIRPLLLAFMKAIC